jgi:Domain of unknown function (DUF5658)
MSAVPEQNKRLGQDRRRQPTSFWDAFRFAGRRVRNRRAEEHRQPHFVDRFSAAYFVWVIALLIFTVTDGVITLALVGRDCQELNPVMLYLLGKGPVWFLVGKYVLTVAGIPILLIFKNYYLFGTPLRVGHLIPIFVLLYLALTLYQFHLFQRFAS